MWIMIAGPYRSGAPTEDGRARNLETLNRAAYEVFMRGHTPVIGVNLALPVIAAAGDETYDRIMMPLSLQLTERCDAILRIGGASPGADREVDVVRANGGRVFTALGEVPDRSRETDM